MVMMESVGLSVGDQVNIQRTDGRVHSAVVSGFNEENSTVTVEWFESEETKGKAIEVDALAKLNPHIFNRRPAASQPNNQAPQAQPLQRAVSESISFVPQNGNKPQPSPARKVTKVVEEAEKIKKNREDRRQRQAEEMKRRQEEDDPSNPNNEFLSMIREYRSKLPPYRSISYDPREHKIAVCVRKRPINRKEENRKDVDVITIPDGTSVIVHEPKLKVDLTKYLENHQFNFDYAFGENSSNELVYQYTAKPLVKTIFEKGMATCFAYGQTGSGKTHTMGGNVGSKKCEEGIYALAAKDVFELLQSPKYREKDLWVSVSFFEIYGGKVFDLLNDKKKLRVLEDAKQQVQVVGLQTTLVHETEEVLDLIKKGNAVRTSGKTSANNNSSRSHAVFQIILKTNSNKKLYGKFSLIDLAGNERGVDTSSADRKTRMEGAEINKSLLALKECIRALGKKGDYTPFRASKLTQVLKDSFIGENSRTVMIATISPGSGSCEHSLNTLRYSDRAKELPGKRSKEDFVSATPAVVEEEENEDFKDMQQMSGNPIGEDLVLLHRSLGREATKELFQFHGAINDIMEDQELLVEEHRVALGVETSLMNEEEIMLQRVDDPDYDMETYSKRLDEILAKKIKVAQDLRDKVAKFSSDLRKEEIASKHVKRMPMF
eukprot:Nk52_evm84s1444 gene=Nk52_evmTU84s1444